MLNENDRIESVLTSFFESMEDSLYSLTNKDKENLNNLTKDNDSYEKLFGIIEDLSNSSQDLERVKNSLESYIDGKNISSAYENEKFYKNGFSDAVNLILECISR